MNLNTKSYFAVRHTMLRIPLSWWRNSREMKSLEEEQKENETALCRIIGFTIETRPDKINPEESDDLINLVSQEFN